MKTKKRVLSAGLTFAAALFLYDFNVKFFCKKCL